MDMLSIIKDYNELKKYFTYLKNEYRPIPFYHMDGDISNDEELNTQFNGYKKSGYGGLALLPVGATRPEYGSDSYYKAYNDILEKAKKLGLKIIYYDDMDFPSGWAGGELAEKSPEALSKILIMREFECYSETVHRKLDKSGKTMSVVALEIDSHEIIDLRPYVSSDECFVDWTPPKGNWNILQFVCKFDKDSTYLNYLSYEASQKFINLTYKRFTDMFEDYIGDVVNMTFYDDIQYKALNRRMWDDDFNKIFEENFGFDPAPYYPAMFIDIGNDTAHYKALFMNCRAKMLINGFFKAISDFTKTHGLISTGHVAEPKTILSPWLYGDGMLYQQLAGAPGLDLIHAYGYGFNGLKLASSSANNFDKEIVTCEIYGNYAELDKDIMYREAMNAFARGINFLIPHTLWYSGKPYIPHEVSHRTLKFKDMLPVYNDFVTRSQTLLRGGRHVCDIAMLYPIYSLQSQTYLYEQPATGFEFPQTPTNADFMNVINAVMNYTIHDITVIHPETLDNRCYSESGTLYLGNKINFEQYRLLIIPGSSMISVKNLRLIKKFYDEGGKIIATTELPSSAFEYDINENYDLEVNEIIKHIFGMRHDEVNSFKEYYYNSNESGGEAYFILSSKTAADGSDMIDCIMLDSIINKLNLNYDVIVNDAPKIINSGILNTALPSYTAMMESLDTPAHKPSGIFNYIHKKQAGCDIYYFANSTKNDYTGKVLLKGRFSVEEWNPHNGKIHKAVTSYSQRNDDTYTEVDLHIENITSVFLVCKDSKI